jgi:cytochrome c peroxidase
LIAGFLPMIWLFICSLIIPLSFAQADLDHYIRKFNYQALKQTPKNKALYDLGFKLFYDQGLSGKNNISCQSCHSLSGYSGDSLPLSIGEGAIGVGIKRYQQDGLVLQRNTPPIYNLHYPEVRALFWDGRVMADEKGGWITPVPLSSEVSQTLSSVLAVQSIFPLTSPEEMLGKESTLSPHEAWNQVMDKIFQGRFKATYAKMFAEAFPGVAKFNIGHVGNALAELMRHHFDASNTLWDLYLRGRKDALSERMKSGAVLFMTKANCLFCHKGDHFTSWGFQNIAIPQIGADDKGRSEVTKKTADIYKFRVPPLRNVGLTAPYMHSGVYKTLSEVIEHYDNPIATIRNFKWNPRHPNYRSPLVLNTDSSSNDNRERTISQKLSLFLDLTPGEKEDLVCFLAVALTDVSLQMDLIKKGVVKDITDCSPKPMGF